MDNVKKMELITELFEVEDGGLTPETELTSRSEWDSVMKLSLIVMIDDECGKTLGSEQIKAFKTIQDIMDYMD